jgi:hypothetical protein
LQIVLRLGHISFTLGLQEYLAFLKIRLGLIIVLLDAFLTPAQAEQKHYAVPLRCETTDACRGPTKNFTSIDICKVWDLKRWREQMTQR